VGSDPPVNVRATFVSPGSTSYVELGVAENVEVGMNRHPFLY
jgi:hypothetical protein